eukprot:4828028-Pleurochrysis_carterae.AAC.3
MHRAHSCELKRVTGTRLKPSGIADKNADFALLNIATRPSRRCMRVYSDSAVVSSLQSLRSIRLLATYEFLTSIRNVSVQ